METIFRTGRTDKGDSILSPPTLKMVGAYKNPYIVLNSISVPL